MQSFHFEVPWYSNTLLYMLRSATMEYTLCVFVYNYYHRRITLASVPQGACLFNSGQRTTTEHLVLNSCSCFSFTLSYPKCFFCLCVSEEHVTRFRLHLLYNVWRNYKVALQACRSHRTRPHFVVYFLIEGKYNRWCLKRRVSTSSRFTSWELVGRKCSAVIFYVTDTGPGHLSILLSA